MFIMDLKEIRWCMEAFLGLTVPQERYDLTVQGRTIYVKDKKSGREKRFNPKMYSILEQIQAYAKEGNKVGILTIRQTQHTRLNSWREMFLDEKAGGCKSVVSIEEMKAKFKDQYCLDGDVGETLKRVGERRQDILKLYTKLENIREAKGKKKSEWVAREVFRDPKYFEICRHEDIEVATNKKGMCLTCMSCQRVLQFRKSKKGRYIAETDDGKNHKGLLSIWDEYHYYTENKETLEYLTEKHKEILEEHKLKIEEVLSRKRNTKIPADTAIKQLKSVSFQISKQKGCKVGHDWFKEEYIIENKTQIEDVLRLYVDGLIAAIAEQCEKERIERGRYKERMGKLLTIRGVKEILNAVKGEEGYGKTTYVKLLKGSKDQKIREYAMDKSEHYGKLNEKTLKDIEGLVGDLLRANLLETYYSKGDSHHKYPKIRVTVQGEQGLNLPEEEEKPQRVYGMGSLKYFKDRHKEEKEDILRGFDKDSLVDIEVFKDVLTFFIECRESYREVLGLMQDILAAVPDRYIPILELNHSMTEGVVKKSIKEVLVRVAEERGVGDGE